MTRKREIYPNMTALKRLEKTGILTGSGEVAQNHRREESKDYVKQQTKMTLLPKGSQTQALFYQEESSY